MQKLEIPASIWLNLGVLAAAVGFIWFKLNRRLRPEDRTRSNVDARRAAQPDR